MKLTPYREMIALAKDKAKELMAIPRAFEQRKRAELEMAKIDSLIAEGEQSINEVTAEYPVNFDRLIDKIDDLALLERRRDQFARIVAEMFPADTPA